jgi:UDP-arabinose 4-epimerase
MSAPIILVTGGAGYIGSCTCKMLAAHHYRPVTYDNLVYGHRQAVQWGPLEEGDLLDSDRLDKVFKTHKPLAVMHFAAFAYVGESVVDPGKYYRNNVCGTINLLDAMRRNGCEKIVFSSTCASFGIPDFLPITETACQKPINPYGRSKLMIERILQDYETAYGIRHVILRYFNAAGADLEGKTGEKHIPETHLIPLVIDAAQGRRQNVEVFGTDYDTPDGTAIRDYIHVVDLADAHVRSLNLLDSTGKSDHFNLGTGVGISVRQIISCVENVSGNHVPVLLRPRRLGDPPELVADSSKAQTVLSWQPEYSNLVTIISSALAWHMRNCWEE